MEKIEYITIEDGRECIVLKEFEHKGKDYVVLVNSMNRNDYILRKIENNKLIGLKDEQEFQEAFKTFLKDMKLVK